MKKYNMAIIISVISLIATIMIYPRLPDLMPMHWNIKGEIDRYDDKYMVLLLGALPLILTLFKSVLPKIDPRKENYKKHGPAYQKLIFATALFLILANWTVIGVALGMSLEINVIIPIGIGILFIIIGNYMPQYRHNYFVGIKTPWTLADEDNWKRTHYLGGFVFMIDGILFIICGFIASEVAIISLSVLMIISVVLLYAYSYYLFAKKQKLHK